MSYGMNLIYHSLDDRWPLLHFVSHWVLSVLCDVFFSIMHGTAVVYLRTARGFITYYTALIFIASTTITNTVSKAANEINYHTYYLLTNFYNILQSRCSLYERLLGLTCLVQYSSPLSQTNETLTIMH